MLSIIAPLLLSILPTPSFVVYEYTCDTVEVNSTYTERGDFNFDQLVFWVWDERIGQFVVDGWLMIGDSRESITNEQRIQLDLATKKEWKKKIPWVDIDDLPGYERKYLGSRMIPTKGSDGYYASSFIKDNMLIKLRCKSVYRTHSQSDSEMNNRPIFPKELRRFDFNMILMDSRRK